MNTLPPKPEDAFIPPSSARGVSPRASSMRASRDGRDRRRSPRRTSPSWRRDDQSRHSRDWDDRRYRPMDRYVPSQGGRTRESRRSRSRSRSLSPRNHRYLRRSRSRSRSRPRMRHRSPERSKREHSRGSCSPGRAREGSSRSTQQETILKSSSDAQGSLESNKQVASSHSANQPPSRPSHTPTGPRYRSPAVSTEAKLLQEKENRMKDSENSRLSHRNSRRYTQDSRSRSHSKSPSRSITRSRQSTPAVRPPLNTRKVLKLEDFLSVMPVRDPKADEFTAEIQRFNTQRTKLETDHVNTIRAVRRAQHELELAMLELKSTEERRKAADRVHELVGKGFTTFVTQ